MYDGHGRSIAYIDIGNLPYSLHSMSCSSFQETALKLCLRGFYTWSLPPQFSLSLSFFSLKNLKGILIGGAI